MSHSLPESMEQGMAHANASAATGLVYDPSNRARETRRETDSVQRTALGDVTVTRGQSRGFQSEDGNQSLSRSQAPDKKPTKRQYHNENEKMRPRFRSPGEPPGRQSVSEVQFAGWEPLERDHPATGVQQRPNFPQPSSSSAPLLGSSAIMSSKSTQFRNQFILQDVVPQTSIGNAPTSQMNDHIRASSRKERRRSGEERICKTLEPSPDDPNDVHDVHEVSPSRPHDFPSPHRSDQETVKILDASDNEGYNDCQESPLAAGSMAPYGQISFEAYHKNVLSTEQVTHDVFDIMRSALTDKKTVDDGYIYTLRLVDHPGYVKIGRTKNPIEKRIKQIQNCFTYELQVLNDRDRCRISNHTRVEKLIHAELRNYRQSFPCACGKKKHDGDEKDGMVQHGEWFKIDTERANRAVARWRNWMGTQPYCDNGLRKPERLRIEHFHSDPKKMQMMKANGKDDWQWDVFLGFTWCQFKRLEIQDLLYRERIRSSRCSVWDSLQKSWQTNLIMYGAVFSWSLTRSVLPLTALTIAGLDTMVMGIGIMFYAALKEF